MPRRAKFLRNPLKWIAERIVPRPAPEPPRQPPRAPAPPPTPSPSPGGGAGPRRSGFEHIWSQDVPRSETRRVSDRTGYSRQEQFQLHLELFLSTYMTELPQDEQEQAWTDYLASFVTGQRLHMTWFEEWGLDPRDFDWESWRTAMGYSRRGK